MKFQLLNRTRPLKNGEKGLETWKRGRCSWRSWRISGIRAECWRSGPSRIRTLSGPWRPAYKQKPSDPPGHFNGHSFNRTGVSISVTYRSGDGPVSLVEDFTFLGRRDDDFVHGLELVFSLPDSLLFFNFNFINFFFEFFSEFFLGFLNFFYFFFIELFLGFLDFFWIFFEFFLGFLDFLWIFSWIFGFLFYFKFFILNYLPNHSGDCRSWCRCAVPWQLRRCVDRFYSSGPPRWRDGGAHGRHLCSPCHDVAKLERHLNETQLILIGQMGQPHVILSCRGRHVGIS